MKFLFFFTFRQLVDAERKFAKSTSKVTILWLGQGFATFFHSFQ